MNVTSHCPPPPPPRAVEGPLFYRMERSVRHQSDLSLPLSLSFSPTPSFLLVSFSPPQPSFPLLPLSLIRPPVSSVKFWPFWNLINFHFIPPPLRVSCGALGTPPAPLRERELCTSGLSVIVWAQRLCAWFFFGCGGLIVSLIGGFVLGV
jgi:hypothetical protein